MGIFVVFSVYDIKQIKKKKKRNNDRISIQNSLLHGSGLQKQKGTVKTMMKWSH